jgi:hypothetical protein
MFVESKSSRSTHKRNQSSSKHWIKPMIKSAKSYLSFANLAYCNTDIINTLACPLCSSILDGSYKVKEVHTANQENHTYRFVLLVSDTHREVVISFSGPKSTDGAYYAGIYTSGWGEVHGEKVEKAYLSVYNKHIKEALQKSVADVLAKEPATNGYKFLMIGHSFGGSLAVLSAYDLLKSGVIQQDTQNNSPLVYSYGQLRIGDDKFVDAVNSLFKVIRIVKSNDHMTRLPNCVWSEQVGKWRCYKNTQNLMIRYPEYRQYIMNYGANNGNKQHYTALQAAYGKRQSFLEKSTRVAAKSHSKAKSKTNARKKNRSKSQHKSKAKSTLKNKNKKTHAKAHSKAHSKAHAKSHRARAHSRKNNRRGYYYSANNPGYSTSSYGSTLTNQGAQQYGNIHYSQPMGAEVLFSNSFKKFQVCSFFNGIPNCENQLPKKFSPEGHANYYGENVEEC